MREKEDREREGVREGEGERRGREGGRGREKAIERVNAGREREGE